MERGLERHMDHKDLRRVLADYFGGWLAGSTAAIDAAGPLSDEMKEGFGRTVGLLEAELKDGALSPAHDDIEAAKFVKHHDLGLEVGTPLFEAFKRSYKQGHRDWAKAVLAYSKAAETFDFEGLPKDISSVQSKATSMGQLTLQALVDEFWKFAKIERRWVGKTEGEKTEHFELLYEVWGKDVSVHSLGRTEARAMRETLIAYPVNRNKLRATRGRPLTEVLNLPGVRTLHILTINKYLQTYSSLFSWAKRNGYCESNPFDGLALRTDKANAEPPRVSFSDEQLLSISSAAQTRNGPAEEHHKWGTLIGIHTGARLNEIAQLHLEDIRQIEGIWCFDINQKPGTKKQLKNEASTRIVPIHPRLIEYGFLDYFDRMKQRQSNERLFPQLTYTKANGYGRNLGRWVNEALLPELGIKTKQLTFHSLRHTMVRKLVAADVSQAHIMAIVGHEPGTTTLKTYNRKGFPPALLLAALEKADAI